MIDLTAISPGELELLYQAAAEDADFARRIFGTPLQRGIALGSSFVNQQGYHVTAVQPGTSIQLFANDLLNYLIGGVEFTVVDAAGNVVFDQTAIAVDLLGNAYVNWTAPMTEGQYTFIPEGTSSYTFTVSKSAPAPGNQGPKSVNWLLIGGIAGGAALVVTAVVLFTKR